MALIGCMVASEQARPRQHQLHGLYGSVSSRTTHADSKTDRTPGPRISALLTSRFLLDLQKANHRTMVLTRGLEGADDLSHGLQFLDEAASFGTIIVASDGCTAEITSILEEQFSDADANGRIRSGQHDGCFLNTAQSHRPLGSPVHASNGQTDGWRDRTRRVSTLDVCWMFSFRRTTAFGISF